MREREPVTRTVKASEARQHWSHLLNQVFLGETRVIVEKSGVPVAAIISADDLARFQRLEAQRREDFKALFDTGAAFQDVPSEEIEREIAEALVAVRASRRIEKFKALDATRAAFQDIPDEELEREVLMAVAAARQQHRAAIQAAANGQ